MKPFYHNAFVLAAALAFSSSAWGHHPKGGETPSTLWQGFLSGLGHPILGIDHLAFIIAIGLLSALIRLRSPACPLILVAATVLGATLQWTGVNLPYVEAMVTTSVVVAGVMIYRTPKQLKIIGIAGIFAAIYHGMAYGEAIIGAETAPLAAYLLGFCLIQIAIAGVAFMAGRWLLFKEPSLPRLVRGLSAGMISGIGLIALSSIIFS
jgi:urease accessory protein